MPLGRKWLGRPCCNPVITLLWLLVLNRACTGFGDAQNEGAANGAALELPCQARSHGNPWQDLSAAWRMQGAHEMKELRTVTRSGCSAGARLTCSATRRCRARRAIGTCGQSSATRHRYFSPASETRAPTLMMHDGRLPEPELASVPISRIYQLASFSAVMRGGRRARSSAMRIRHASTAPHRRSKASDNACTSTRSKALNYGVHILNSSCRTCSKMINARKNSDIVVMQNGRYTDLPRCTRPTHRG